MLVRIPSASPVSVKDQGQCSQEASYRSCDLPDHVGRESSLRDTDEFDRTPACRATFPDKLEHLIERQGPLLKVRTLQHAQRKAASSNMSSMLDGRRPTTSISTLMIWLWRAMHNKSPRSPSSHIVPCMNSTAPYRPDCNLPL